jgi:hypothetical protein
MWSTALFEIHNVKIPNFAKIILERHSGSIWERIKQIHREGCRARAAGSPSLSLAIIICGPARVREKSGETPPILGLTSGAYILCLTPIFKYSLVLTMSFSILQANILIAVIGSIWEFVRRRQYTSRCLLIAPRFIQKIKVNIP